MTSNAVSWSSVTHINVHKFTKWLEETHSKRSCYLCVVCAQVHKITGRDPPRAGPSANKIYASTFRSTFVYDVISREFTHITCSTSPPNPGLVTAMCLSVTGKTLFLAVFDAETRSTRIRTVDLTSKVLICRQEWSNEPLFTRIRSMTAGSAGVFLMVAEKFDSTPGESIQ
jgi:hypothetical protein